MIDEKHICFVSRISSSKVKEPCSEDLSRGSWTLGASDEVLGTRLKFQMWSKVQNQKHFCHHLS